VGSGLKTAHNTLVDRVLFRSFLCVFFFAPVATSPLVVTGILSLVIWVFSGKFIKERHRWFGQKWALPVLILLLLPWIGLLWSEDPAGGLDFAKKSYYWLFAFAIASIYLSTHRVHAFIKAYIAGVSFTSLLFVLQVTGIINAPHSIGLMSDVSYISLSLLLAFCILILSFYFGKVVNKRDKILCLALMLLNFSSFIMLTSDSGHLAFVILSPFIAYNLLNKKHLLKILVVSVLMVGGLFLSPVAQNRLLQAVNETKAYAEGNVVTAVGLRYYMWKGALKVYLENPLFGAGTGGYEAVMKRYKTDENIPDLVQPHNSFLYIAANYGIVGILVFLWLFTIVLKNSWQKRNSLPGFAVFIYTVVLLIGSLTESQIIMPHTGILFSLFVGLQGALNEEC
jgi:O-antigen ligase